MTGLRAGAGTARHLFWFYLERLPWIIAVLVMPLLIPGLSGALVTGIGAAALAVAAFGVEYAVLKRREVSRPEASAAPRPGSRRARRVDAEIDRPEPIE